jgi:hypothetical protein
LQGDAVHFEDYMPIAKNLLKRLWVFSLPSHRTSLCEIPGSFVGKKVRTFKPFLLQTFLTGPPCAKYLGVLLGKESKIHSLQNVGRQCGFWSNPHFHPGFY